MSIHSEEVVAGASVVAGGSVSEDESSPEFTTNAITTTIATTARIKARIVPNDDPRACVTWTVGCGGPSAESPAPLSSPARPSAVAQASELLTADSEASAPPVQEETGDLTGRMRKWRDASGQVVAVGELVALQDGKVCLETRDGAAAVVPLDRLCDADRSRPLHYLSRRCGAADAVVLGG